MGFTCYIYSIINCSNSLLVKFMKKYLFITIIAITFFTFSTSAFATSGACSDHGGVNCSAGASINGSAICNDGFESSTLYPSGTECFGVNTAIYEACSSSFPTSEFTKYTQSIASDKQLMQTKEQRFIDQEKGFISSTKIQVDIGIQKISLGWNPIISSYQSDENNAVAGLKKIYNVTIGNNDGIMNPISDSDYQVIVDNTKAKYEPKIQSITSEMNDAIAKFRARGDADIASHNSCIDSLKALLSKMQSAGTNDITQQSSNCGLHSSLNTQSQTCDCDSGYVGDPTGANQCVLTQIFCQAILPNGNFHIDGRNCVCNDGYEFDSNKKNCITVVKNNTPSLKTTTSNSSTVTAPISKKLIAPVITSQTNTPADTTPLTQPVVSTPTQQPKEGLFKKMWNFFTNLF